MSDFWALVAFGWWRGWPQFCASLLPYSSHSSLSECWLAFRTIWRVNYNPHQWFNSALGKDVVQTVEHLTYANMTLHRLFYKARNNILRWKFLLCGVWLIAVKSACWADSSHHKASLQTLLSCCSVSPMDCCSGCMCYFSILCVITSFMAF